MVTNRIIHRSRYDSIKYGTENTTISAGTVPNFGSVISTAAGSGDGFAGSITSGHGITGLHEGDSGSTVTGQFVTELTIR